MKLIKCETCGKEIAKKAKTCPHCGAKRKVSVIGRGILAVVITLFILNMLMGMGSGGVPYCDSSYAISLVKMQLQENLINAAVKLDYYNATADQGSMYGSSNYSGMAMELEIIDVESPKEVAYDENTSTRSCTGTIVSNKWTKPASYSLKLLTDGDVYVDVALN